jgi:transposase
MIPIALLLDLPGCRVEQVNSSLEAVIITASATQEGASCPDCSEFSSRVHSSYLRSPRALPSHGRSVRLLLRVRRFRCSNPICQRKTFAETFPLLIAPHAQRTEAVRDLLRIIGEALGGEAGARLSKQLALGCSPATLLRQVRVSPLAPCPAIRVLGVDEWAWRKGTTYGTLLVDLERQIPVDVLKEASADSFAAWLALHPTIEIISRDRGTTFADGASRGAPQALQIADRWHLLQNLGETLEKILARHHADLKRALTSQEADLSPDRRERQAHAETMAEQIRQARQDRREEVFTQVHDLHEQGWSFASIARMLGINKKTVVKYANAEQFPSSRNDRGRKLAPYLHFLRTQWETGEHNIAHLYQTIREKGYRGSETAVRNYLTALREEVGPPRRASRYAPPVSASARKRQRLALSSRRATSLVLRHSEDLSEEDWQNLGRIVSAHPQVASSCQLAQSFAKMVRERDATALEPWLQQAHVLGIPELRRFANGIQLDQKAVQAALIYPWSQGQVEGQIHRLKLIKRQGYGRSGFDLLRHRVLARSA